ncbi:expansin EXLX1 family cellulose-binding protein [Dactylosporangium sp. NBC_01737]|uniref:expansin EXLX1 family cellulose-binding protein n=1 Tax=Dactylosporangium sp. NBC_01737 TaxID=2975959 RepID=UPI002E0E9046|nr:expansin EXLX1 family cellulose-binding protein [Dactylosporangium sp. NBC_01737]
MLDNPEPSPWWMRRRTWVVAAAGAVVAGTATVALVAQASGAACAAAAASSGQATYYAADGGGNCSFDKVSNPLVVALGNAEYAAGAACGGYLDVKGPKGTVRVKVTDRCPECAAGHLDLSRQAFAKIGDPVAGVIKVTYSKVTSPPSPGPMTVRVKEGSSRYWLALRLDNTGNPLSGVELQSGGGWKALSHTDYNYWIAQNGAGTGPFTIRVTDTAGRRTTLSGVTLTVGTVQRPGAAAAGTTAPKTPAASRSGPAASTAAAESAAASPTPPTDGPTDGPTAPAVAAPPARCG